MINLRLIITTLLSAAALTGCAPEGMKYYNKIILCDFEGAYWNALVDSNPNGDNLLNGTIATSWHDEESNLSGAVTQPYDGYWEGFALSNHCSKDCAEDGKPTDQLFAYADSAYSGKNFLICNCFFGGVELHLGEEVCWLGSMRVANTTYLHNVATNGNHLTAPLGDNESIWIEAKGYINGSEDVQATAKFYLYKNGKPAFDGWEKWYMSSMCKVNKIVFDIKWDGTGYNPYPAYFALDNIEVVHKVLKEEYQTK